MKYSGSCHCVKVKFEVEMDVQEGLTCNCSICHRKGTILTFVPKTQFSLLSGQDCLTDYQFGKKSIHHTFCSTCGVTPFATGSAPDGSTVAAINIRCLDNVDINTIQLHKYDGKKL